MATRLTQSMTSGGSTTKFTKSIWVKRTGLTQGYVIDSQDDEVAIQFRDDHKLNVFIYSPSSYSTNLVSNQLFRDTNAWYHIVYAVDYTNATQAHRARVYVNGEEITSWSTETRPGNNTTTFNTFNSSITHYIGNNAAANKPFDGLMSHVIHVDGTQYAPTEFGETDSTTGEWKIKTAPSVTWGTKGYWVLKDGNSVTDASPNTNNWTVGGGTLTKTEDCPSNVFATLNPLVNNQGEMMLLTNGNTSCQSNAAQGNSWKLAVSTLGMTSGKYYWEIKFDNVHNCYNNGVMGSNILTANTSNPMNQTGYTGFYNIDGGEIRKDNVVTTQDYGTYATNDIMGVACDMDNYTITFYKNGSAFVSNVALSTTGRDVVFPCSVFYNTNNTGIPQASYNFGNGYFGTTAISSAGSNGNGSLFEYDVPTGYTALSTKGLNL